MAPLAQKLSAEPGIESVVVVTAQHRQMLDQVLNIFGIVPDIDLDLMKQRQTLTSITTSVLEGMGQVFDTVKPDLVLVHGDTTTTMSASLAAFYRMIPVGHVEAGLRTFDKYSPYPEEMNRLITGRIAQLHFCPTRNNARNLQNEGVHDGVFVTGNTVIDALKQLAREEYSFQSPSLSGIDLRKYRTIAMTAHRRENLGQPMRDIFQAVREIVLSHPDVQVVYPVHLNPAVQQPAHEILGDIPRVHLIDPIDVQDMHNLMARSYMVMTDSGGLQEEAPALGKPVLVLRTETERPEAVEAGTVRMAGVEKERIISMAHTLLTDPEEYAKMANAVNPYGDGLASGRIVKIIKDWAAEKKIG